MVGFLIIIVSFGFFGPYGLEKAFDNCEGESITKECYLDAVGPVVPLDYSKLND